MTQTRYFARAGKTDALALFDRLDARFGEEGVPVAIVEIDEASGEQEVSAYFEDDGAFGREAIEAAFAPVTADREDLPEIDWMQSVLADLKPVRAGRFLVHGAHDRDKVSAGDIAIEIEAGQAFGTGHHGTTEGCLTMIGEIARRRLPARVLDLGTGSAVLAIGVAKLVRVPVLATDIDPVAVRVAKANVRANGVAGLVDCVTAGGFHASAFSQARPFDLIVANILAGPLMKLAPQMARHLAPGGDVVLSGILTRQRRAVLAAYSAQGLYHRKTLTRGEWVTLHLSR
ncbi:50S ribosomal protein L11 methyltransferase [Aureimonas mangrovi]|uniref:50S ribosomal protein L11 methyltransferase n=1 Tax=Aureimonas mangrovi TaxID=2758041 RepID=UPI00163D80D0|nr:50S ribosomal protein L11 methyltransferase [Aureimonas mangrovi]